MRIAFVAPFGLRAKGTARARALPLALALARRGHSVALFVPPYDSPEDSGRQWWEEAARSGDRPQPEAGGRPPQAGVDVINVLLPPGRQGAIWHLRLGWRLFQAVRGWRPDVVHVFKPKGPSGLVGLLLWLTRRRTKDQGRRTANGGFHFSSFVSRWPSLVVDADDWEGPGGWNDDPRAGYSSAQRRFFAWQERYGLSHADAWTVASECLRDRAITFGAAPDRAHVLHNGTSLCSIQPLITNPQSPSAISHQQSKIENQKSAILYTRFAGVRPAEVAAMWGLVRERMPDARLVVVGRGLAGEERDLAGLPGIEVRGWVEPAALPGVFAGAALAIAPWVDTPSNRARHSAKILELMTAGLPVVAPAVGELAATLGDAGVLVPAGDRAAFADAVVALLADPARAEALGRAARERVRRCFDWDALAEVALAAYSV